MLGKEEKIIRLKKKGKKRERVLIVEFKEEKVAKKDYGKLKGDKILLGSKNGQRPDNEGKKE